VPGCSKQNVVIRVGQNEDLIKQKEQNLDFDPNKQMQTELQIMNDKLTAMALMQVEQTEKQKEKEINQQPGLF
jgi:hypothetical protein